MISVLNRGHKFGMIQDITKKASLIWYYTLGVLGLQEEDVILTSFPKSGNTWVRFFLCNLISLEEWGGREITFPLLDDTMPEVGRSNLLKEWKYDVIPRIVKTHKRRLFFMKKCHSIFLVRDPRDVMVSYYFFDKGRVNTDFDGSFSDFLRHPRKGLKGWVQHYQSWREHADVVVRFEDMKADDIQAFSNMLKGIGSEVGGKVIMKAAKRSRFEEMKKKERE